MTILPVGIDLLNWSAQLRNEYPQEEIPELRDEKDWKSWATTMYNTNAFPGSGFPLPDGFSDWKAWAARFTLAIGG